MQNSATWDAKAGQNPSRAGLRAYLLAVISVGVALGARLALDPLWKDRLPFASFFLAVIVVAHFRDTGPSLFAIIAGFALGDWFFVAPRGSLLIHGSVDQFNAVCYFISCFVVLYFAQQARRALARERAARLELSRSSETLVRDNAERKKAENDREELVVQLRQEVAERETAQRALQESQQMTLHQERLAAVGRLAAGLAHEFNNILTVIQGHAALLLDNPKMDEDSVKSIKHITEGVERTAALVKQMLAFSRKQVMQQRVVHLEEIMAHVTGMLGRLLGAHVALRIEIAPQMPPIKADPDMLQQVLVNLAVNARDAMANGGQVTIRAREVGFAARELAGKPDRREGRFVQLSVTDTGSGIDPANVVHLFEPFFTTKEIGKGTGLGLATVHGIVNQHSGWIEVESALGRGTTFHIYFPASGVAAEKRLPDKGPPRARGRGETILVVEDETVLRDLVREILEAQGYRVFVAASGREALEVWEKQGDGINLVLTDMSMPDGMSGQDLAARLQQRNPRLPVIFSSGYTQDTMGGKMDDGSGTSFLSKPYNPSDLAKSVRASLDQAAESAAALAESKN